MPLVLLQSLRAVAAGLVVICHIYAFGLSHMRAAIWLPKGTVACEGGVDLFFVISGFIMMHITPRPLRSWAGQLSFLFRRFARIYPTYWAVAIPLLFVWYRYPNLINNFSGHRVDVAATLLLIPSKTPGVLTVAWSLVCELWFYVVASFIFYGSDGFRFGAALVWGFIVLAVNVVLLPARLTDPLLATVFHPQTIEFIGGMLLGYFFHKGTGRVSPTFAAVATALSFVVMFAWGSYRGDYFSSPEGMSRLLFYGGPACVIVAMALEMDLQGQWRWLTRLAPVGERSYSLYLVHLPIIAAMYRICAPTLIKTGVFALPLAALISIPIVGAVTECLYRIVEKPTHELARQASKKVGAYFLPRATGSAPRASGG